MTIDLNILQAAKVVDARAMSCPGPLLEAKKGIATVKVGEILEIWSGDTNTKTICRAGVRRSVMNSWVSCKATVTSDCLSAD